jgi:hypothetical protein
MQLDIRIQLVEERLQVAPAEGIEGSAHDTDARV